MSLLQLVDDLQATIDRLRAEVAFANARATYRAGIEHHADQVELLIARRLEALNNWTPHVSAMSRRHELHLLRDAIRAITTTTDT